MHEASLVRGLLDLALKSRADYNLGHPGKNAGKITEIRCSYGLLACFEPETLRACFELFAEGTPAEGADLILEAESLSCSCSRCKASFILNERRFLCPECGSMEISFAGGSGLTLQAINVDSEEMGND